MSKMTDDFFKTLPWRIAAKRHKTGFYLILGRDEGDRELQILTLNDGPHPIKEHLDRIECNAEAIVSAVNQTYGNGINPESVPKLLDALKVMVEYFEWLIKDPDFHAYKTAKDALNLSKL